jgi:hypothetical protein
MIETIVSDALAKIAEGSGAALVDLISRRLFKRHESSQASEALARVEAGNASEDDRRELQALLVKYADEDPAFLSQLQRFTMSVDATNSVAFSNVQKLIQAQQVGDVTM